MPAGSLDQFRLDGRVAVVTGAARGLGRAIARGLADVGAAVALVDVQPPGITALEDELIREGRDAWAVPCDVSVPAEVDAMASGVHRQRGRIDVLVHAAGIGGRHPAVDYPIELWNRVLGVNLTGAFLCCQAVGRIMLAQGHGSIVTIASLSGFVGWRGSVGYQVSKAGVGQLSRSLGIEWARRGVRVNSIAPGPFDTPTVREEAAADPDYPWSPSDATPMGRMAEDHEIVGAAIFLASDASRYMTGQVLVIDGGYVAQ